MIAIHFRSMYTIFAMLSVVLVTSSAYASPRTFNFNGIVQDNSEKSLFLGKSIGDSYAGSFTVDPEATVTADYVGARNYEGSFFDVTIDGTSYDVHTFNVWLNGIEFDFIVDRNTAFLSLRSIIDIYTAPDVPVSFNLNDFDDLAWVDLSDLFNPFEADRSSVLAIAPAVPEPTALGLLVLGSIAASRSRSGSIQPFFYLS